MSYPELVERFRTFAEETAKEARKLGGRVIIGVDELDKIGSAEQANHFLNEIKGLFAVENVYFLVTVADDALTAFEQRGLPVRDAIDSSFDEIVQAKPLTYQEARRLLHRRVIGLNEPYIALCHCLSGGLARDLIRAARQVVHHGHALAQAIRGKAPETPKHAGLAQVTPLVVRNEVRRRAHALQRAAATALGIEHEPALLVTLHQTTDSGAATDLIHLLRQVTQNQKIEAETLKEIRNRFAAYVYFAITLEEVFNASLDEQRMQRATRDGNHPGTFDALARARHAFSISTPLALHLIHEFRTEWKLPVRWGGAMPD